MNWRDKAACVGTNQAVFFPEDVGDVNHAKSICKTCPVREDCLEFALTTNEDHGVWGGTSARERRRMRRRRAIADRAAGQ